MAKDELEKQSVVDYFSSIESRWGYSAILRGIKHYGYYPENTTGTSMKEAQYLMMDKLHDALNLPNGSRILDAGCGEGKTALYLAARHNYNITGIDLLDKSVRKANKNKSKLGIERVNFRAMDYAELDFQNETFNGVYSLESLVHATDYLKTLREFHRVLRHRGKLVLFEYSILSEQEMTSRERKIIKPIIEVSAMHSLPHFIHGRFPEILEGVGFSNIAVEDMTPRVMPMLKCFYQLSYFPYGIIKTLGLRRKLINTTAAFETYRIIRNNPNVWRYNIVTATKMK